MARVSRKNKAQEILEPIEHIYNTAIYIRLSIEDSGTNSSETIETQQYMVEQFVNAQKDMKLYSIYKDNGFTGTNFQRPAFEQMMDDVRDRKIDCIVVKDLSRFGRNYIETGYYLEKIFPFLNVRFVAITDHYDTLKNSSSDDMVGSLKNIVNSLVAKDISHKSATVLHQKQQNGEYIGAFAPYGYMKNLNQKNHLIIDPVTAPIVKEIFKWKLEGMGYIMIARKLNEKSIPSPSVYNFQSGRYKQKTVPTGRATMWQGQMVKRILNNFTYTGNVTQGKTVESLCNGLPLTKKDKKQYVVVYGTHEPIIDEETFRNLEKMSESIAKQNNESRGKYPFKENIFKGKVFCADCGQKMIRYKNAKKSSKTRYVFLCNQYAHNLQLSKCSKKCLGEPELINAILSSLKVQVELTFSLEDKLKKLKSTKKYIRKQKKIKIDLVNTEKLISKNLLLCSALFENYTDGTIDLVEYNRLKSDYLKQAEELEEAKNNLRKAQALDEKILSPQNEWIKAFRREKDTTVLSREFIKLMIDKIIVSGYNDVEIIWKFSDELAFLTEFVGGAA
ncbi:MAG: recombinase family protein [Paludibacter sp.]|nr:recombinase family protein [Paludibacter sp.]